MEFRSYFFVLYVPTVLAFTSLKKEYKSFFAILSIDIAELSSFRQGCSKAYVFKYIYYYLLNIYIYILFIGLF